MHGIWPAFLRFLATCELVGIVGLCGSLNLELHPPNPNPCSPLDQALKIQALSAVASGSNFRAIVNELSSLVSAFDNTLSASAIQVPTELHVRILPVLQPRAAPPRPSLMRPAPWREEIPSTDGSHF